MPSSQLARLARQVGAIASMLLMTSCDGGNLTDMTSQNPSVATPSVATIDSPTSPTAPAVPVAPDPAALERLLPPATALPALPTVPAMPSPVIVDEMLITPVETAGASRND